MQYYIKNGVDFIDCELYKHCNSGIVRYGAEWKKVIRNNPFMYNRTTFEHVSPEN